MRHRLTGHWFGAHILLVLLTTSVWTGNASKGMLVSSEEARALATPDLTPGLVSAAESQATIDVDFSKPVGTVKPLQQVHGGPIPRQRGAAQLHEQYKQIGVDYVRPQDNWPFFDIDCIFPRMEADASSEASYNFSSTDPHVRAIKSIGADVFYRLGYSWGGPNTPPSDYEKLAEICKHIVMHYNQGWAKGFRYGIQYWEIWNEPNNKVFWTGTADQFYRLYDTIARILKTADPSIKVGGPAVAIQLAGTGFLDGFLQFCKLRNSPLDFVSWHIYTQGLGPQLIAAKAFEVQSLLNQHGFDKAENILSEYNMFVLVPRTTPEYWNARGAAWAASALVYLQNTSVSKAFWYRGESELGRVPPPQAGPRWIVVEQYGLFYFNGTFKKHGYAFLAMKKLTETPVSLACTGSNNAGFAALAGKTMNGSSVRVLISDFDANYEGFTLTVKNHTWQGKRIRCEIYLLDDTNNLALIEKSEQRKEGPIIISHKIAASSVYLVSLEAIEQTIVQTKMPQTTAISARSEPAFSVSTTQILLVAMGLSATVALLAVKLRKRRPPQK